MTKVTPKNRRAIRAKYKSGKYTHNQLAVKYGICVATIKSIINRSNQIDR